MYVRVLIRQCITSSGSLSFSIFGLVISNNVLKAYGDFGRFSPCSILNLFPICRTALKRFSDGIVKCPLEM